MRSEKDPFTLMRLIEVNIENTDKTIAQSIENGAQKYFCVSTDKAANPVNMMGASKRIMEMFLMRRSLQMPISTARFTNVAFSDGSLLHGFNQRIQKRQPLSAPSDVRRYFVTPIVLINLIFLPIIVYTKNIYYIKEKPLTVREKFFTLKIGDIGISSIATSELFYGVFKSQNRIQNKKALDSFLLPLLISEYGYDASVYYGEVRASLEKAGNIIGPLDLQIAAHALSLGVTLVTNNTKEFKRVKGLKLESWV